MQPMLIGNPGYPVKVDELRGISQMAGIQDKEEIDRCPDIQAVGNKL